MRMHTPRMFHLKPNITYVCDRGCPNCNRATRLCPSSEREDLSPEQFAKMLGDSARVGHKWLRITLTGGEPTMHPQFEQIVDAMMDYKREHNPECKMCTYTYHHREFFEKVERVKAKYPDFIVFDTKKDKPRIHLYAPHMAPVDDPKFGPGHAYIGCHLGGHLCGLGYDSRGFFCCSLGAAIARIFALGIAVPNVADISRDVMIGQFKHLCSRCGFYNLAKPSPGNGEPISPAWKDAIERYNRVNGTASGS